MPAQTAQRKGLHFPSQQTTLSFQGANVAAVTEQINEYTERYTVRVVALSVFYNPIGGPGAPYLAVVTFETDRKEIV